MTLSARRAAGALFAVILLGVSLSAEAARPRPSVADKAAANDRARALELEAEIARRTQAYQQRLRRQQIAGDETESRFESYLAAFRRKIACSASLHYPKAARGRIYGDLVITVSILADGSLEDTKIERSSGHKVLDEGARDIARKAAPFAPFPPEIRRDADAIDITRTWTFTYTEESAENAEDPCAE